MKKLNAFLRARQKGRSFLLVAVLLGSTGLSEAFVRTRTSGGTAIQWDGSSTINLRVDAGSSTSLSSSDVMSVVNYSVGQWNATSADVTMSAAQASSSDSSGVNMINFTDSSYFSSGVIAVTSVSYSASSGDIIEGDISVNNLYTYSTNSTATSPALTSIYLGDVLTHELGHFIGLSHSEVQESSMIYTIFKGQHSTSYDDAAGAEAIYPSGTKGQISGKVIGGDSLIGVFGANVQAISTSTGSVAGSALSDDDGTFTIYGLGLNDTYFLYVGPTKVSGSLPSYYSTVQSNFCSGGSYRGSFFTKCGDSEAGRPQGIALSSSTTSVDIGSMTIHCNLETPENYLTSKDPTPRNNNTFFDASAGVAPGGAFTGMFYSSEVSTSKTDTLTVDLTNYTVPSDGGSYYLDLKLISQNLFSALEVDVHIERDGGAGAGGNDYDYSANTTTNSDGVAQFNVLMQVPLDADETKNTFVIEITPKSITDNYSTFIPSPSVFMDSLSMYMMIGSISKADGSGGYDLYAMKDYTPYEDNSSCPDASNTYAVSAYTTNSDEVAESLSSGSTSSSGGGGGCGTVDLDPKDGPGGPMGPLNLAIGFMMVLLINQLGRKTFQKTQE